MTAPPTDRGIAFIKKNADGTQNVYVAMAVDAAGKPADVFAVYRGRRSVVVQPSVRLVSAGTMTRTQENVRVFSGVDGEVRILSRREGTGAMSG